MAIIAEESSSALPARPVFIKNKRSSQAMRTGVAMPTYTIQDDPPWVTGRASHAPTASSIYSDEYDEALPDKDAPDVPQLNNKPSYHPSYHAHSQQQIMDTGLQVRQSRLPIFKQVRSMLHKPPPIVTLESIKWDEYSGELSETGRPPQVKPSAYVSPYESLLRLRKRSPERRNKNKGDTSPISILRDDEVKPPPPLKVGRNSPRAMSPVSPVSPVSRFDYGAPTPLLTNERALPGPRVITPSIKQIKRKPTPMSASATENITPQRSPSAKSDWTEPPDDDEPQQDQQQQSHFSWTTYAPSVALGRPSIDSTATRHTKQPSTQEQHHHHHRQSHFSWSTVNTTMTYQNRPDSPPPSPPPPIPTEYVSTPSPPPPAQMYKPYTSPQPPIPAKNAATPSPQPETYKPRGLPVQSILSRQRPVQRMDKTEKQEWTPPPRKSSATPTPRSATTTPSSAIHPALRDRSIFSTQQPNSSVKALPLPPAPATPLSHLDSLLAAEKDLQHQRKNVERGIAELEKVLKASPIDVGWKVVKETEKKMEEHRWRLEEVVLEEREVGIKISRVRRKEGEEEGLWVRRVTG